MTTFVSQHAADHGRYFARVTGNETGRTFELRGDADGFVLSTGAAAMAIGWAAAAEIAQHTRAAIAVCVGNRETT